LTQVAPPSGEPVEIGERGAMTDARKRRIHEKRKGICRICKEPVPMFGPNVRYDHIIPHWLKGDDSDANIWPIHRDPCDLAKTAKDQGRIAKTKRQKAKHDGTFPPAKQKLRGRGFDRRWTP
jgi:hypothetical protein